MECPLEDDSGSTTTSNDSPSTQQPSPPESKWSASYSKRWVPAESSEQKTSQNVCFDEANPGTRLIPVNPHKRSERTVTYNGKILSLQSVSRRNRFGENMLQQAVIQGDVRKIQAILQLKPYVNHTDNAGCSALHEAALRGHHQVCQLLIQSGASVNISARNGVTPLHCAVQSKHLQIAELLLKHGANAWPMDQNGETTFGLSDEPTLSALILQRPPGQKRKPRKSLLCPTQSLPCGNSFCPWSEKESHLKISLKSEEQMSSVIVRTEPCGLTSIPIQVELKTSNKAETCVSPAASPLPSSLTPLWTGQDSGEDTDSDLTRNYLSSPENDWEDWILQDTQNFSAPDTTVHTEDMACYTFPTECV